jgi:hypothetical protein
MKLNGPAGPFTYGREPTCLRITSAYFTGEANVIFSSFVPRLRTALVRRADFSPPVCSVFSASGGQAD